MKRQGEGTVADTAMVNGDLPDEGDPLTGAVWRLRSRGCWEEAADLVAERDGEPGAALLRAALLGEGCLYTGEGWERAEDALRAAEAVPTDDEGRGAAACERGHLAWASTLLGVRDRADEARAALGRAAALLPPDSARRALLDYRRGLLGEYLSDGPQGAEAAYRRAHAAAAARGDLLLLSGTWRQLGGLALHSDNPGEARLAFRESLRLREELGFLVGIAPALEALASVESGREAERLREEARRLFRMLGGVPRWLAPRLGVD
ncbi:hypothetical protein [Streptomyces calidiresistens]|uniref:hypothetical protein n=1 Tax=Streptomyces calidiresistens TaxID=1485586 RepID=UPI003F691750